MTLKFSFEVKVHDDGLVGISAPESNLCFPDVQLYSKICNALASVENDINNSKLLLRLYTNGNGSDN